MACDGSGSIYVQGSGLEPCPVCRGAGCERLDPVTTAAAGAMSLTGPASVVIPADLQSRLKFSTRRDDIKDNAREINAEISRLESELAAARQFQIANRALCAHDGGVLLCPVCGRSV